MVPWSNRRRWAKGTYMKLQSAERLRSFLVTREDIAAYKAGRPIGNKMTQRGLADRVGVTGGFINHLTSGRKSACTPEVAERIAEVLGVPLEVLFDVKVSGASRQPINRQMKLAG